ncbi:MAG TPA: AMP-binding protein [Gemmatimonadales bacterium]|nr:AMP-binding protein [Gemmatimonadales bacterium]
MSSHAAAATRQGEEIFSLLQPIGEPESVGAMLARNAARLGEHPALGEWHGSELRLVSWARLHRDVTAFARFLARSGVRPGDRVAAVSTNRGEMLVAELATMTAGATWVPVFAGYSAFQARVLVEQAGPAALLLPNAEALRTIGVPFTVHTVVTFEPVEARVRETARRHAWTGPTQFTDAIEQGATGPDREPGARAVKAVAPGDTALMMYTSGTSGRLKGVLLTHDNLLSQQRALAAIWQISPADRFLSYLPWHHSFGGIFEKYIALFNGATLYLDDSLGKDLERLLANWVRVQPTVYFSVPKVYQQLVARAEARPDLEARIFHPGLRFVFTAAAPLPQNLSAFFATRKIPVLEGWGLTETAPCCTLTDLAEARRVPGMVGYPIPGVRIRLDHDGEILVRGPNVMRGYFDDPDSTRAAISPEGWFRTGDLGALVGNGLRLVGRRDRVFKLLNAEKVVPTEIENRLAGMNSYIRHVLVAGGGRDHIMALIYPDYFRIAEEFGADRAAAERAVKDSLRRTILEFNETHPVPYERIKAFAVVSRELSVERDELTPSLKVRVNNVLDSATEYFDAVYEPGPGCDCRFLRKVMRLEPDSRPCFAGRDRTLDRCHECGGFIFDDGEQPAEPQGGEKA